MNLKQVVFGLVVSISLFLIIYLAVWVRLGTVNTPTVLDYDPWWFYRYAKEILANLFFIFNWGGGWLSMILFLAFIPAFIVFRFIEQFIHTWKFKFDFSI